MRVRKIFCWSSFLVASLFWSCQSSDKLSPWDVIDPHSLLIYESAKPVGIDTSLQRLFASFKAPFFVTLQNTSRSEYELAYMLDGSAESAEALTIKLQKAIPGKITKRVFNGFEINEKLTAKGAVALAFASLDGIIVVSRSPLLVENSIRTYEEENILTFKDSHEQLFQFASVKADDGNLYINVPQFKNLFGNSSWMKSVPMLSRFAVSSILDVTHGEDYLFMTGFTLDSSRQANGLHIFQEQRPVSLDLFRLVPNHVKSIVHFGISDFPSFHKSTRTVSLTGLKTGDEFAFGILDGQQRYLGFLELENGEQSLEPISSGEYSEDYSGHTILSIKAGVMTTSFKSIMPQDAFSYMALKENFIILSGSVDDLKSCIDAIEADDAWGKSVEFQQFYEKGLKESNVSFIFQRPEFEKTLQSAKWKPFFDSLHLNNLTWGAIQFSSLDNNFYTNVNLSWDAKKKPSVANEEKPVKNSVLTLPNSVGSGVVVRNSISGANELLVQDSTYRIFLASQRDGVLWSYSLDGRIQGDVHQIDFYKNGKLQYLLVTARKLYLIDRLGRDVSGFPKNLNFDANFCEVVDYDRSKNYRYMVSSQKGDIYILDKDANPLEGWNPKRIGVGLNETPRHYKIGGKDYFFALSSDGSAHLFNRRGDYEKGFPLKQKETFSGTYFIETGSSLQQSFLYLVNSNGKATKQNLLGEPASKEELVRGRETKFTLVRTDQQKDFYYVRVGIDKIAVFDKKNQLVFERENPGSVSLSTSVFELSSQRRAFCFFDNEQKLSYLFDQVGNALSPRPLESSITPCFGIQSSNKKAFAYSFFENAVTITVLE